MLAPYIILIKAIGEENEFLKSISSSNMNMRNNFIHLLKHKSFGFEKNLREAGGRKKQLFQKHKQGAYENGVCKRGSKKLVRKKLIRKNWSEKRGFEKLVRNDGLGKEL